MMCMPFCLRHISIGFLEEDSFETWSNRHSFSYTRSLLPLPTLPTFLKFSLSIGASPQQLPQGLKFEPYGRTLAKMLGTLLKVPCEAGCRRVFGGKKRSPGLGFFWCMKYYPVIYVGIIRYQYKDPLSNNQHFNGKEGSPFFFRDHDFCPHFWVNIWKFDFNFQRMLGTGLGVWTQWAHSIWNGPGTSDDEIISWWPCFGLAWKIDGWFRWHFLFKMVLFSGDMFISVHLVIFSLAF